MNGLTLRMILYFVFAGLAGAGLIDFDAESGSVTVSLDQVEWVLGGGLSYLVTFIASRWFKSRGGAT